MKVVIIETDKIIFEGDEESQAVLWVSDLLYATHNFSLLSELNTMQQEADVQIGIAPHLTENVFANKYTIPPYFINLVIKDYGLKIVED